MIGRGLQHIHFLARVTKRDTEVDGLGA